MSDVLRQVVVAVLVAVALGVVAWYAKRAKPLQLGDDEWAMKPSRLVVWPCILVGCAIVFGSLYLFISLDGMPLSLIMLLVGFVLFGAFAAGYFAPYATRLYEVVWNRRGIEGPSQLLFLTLTTSRTSIAWADVESTGRLMSGYCFIEAKDGRRVYWTSLHIGHGLFIGALKANCPNVPIRI